jgi:hypothetical protein
MPTPAGWAVPTTRPDGQIGFVLHAGSRAGHTGPARMPTPAGWAVPTTRPDGQIGFVLHAASRGGYRGPARMPTPAGWAVPTTRLRRRIGFVLREVQAVFVSDNLLCQKHLAFVDPQANWLCFDESRTRLPPLAPSVRQGNGASVERWNAGVMECWDGPPCPFLPIALTPRSSLTPGPTPADLSPLAGWVLNSRVNRLAYFDA